MIPAAWRKWLAVGTGVGIEIGPEDLRVVVTRVRPRGTTILGAAELPRFRQRPAGEWGQEYASFLRKTSGSYLAATVLLPREDVIVRTLALPGVATKDLAAAVQFQLDGLHPFPEDDVLYTWARIGDTPGVLVGIARREVVDSYRGLFAEAGIKIASFTFSAAALYAGTHLLSTPPTDFVALETRPDGIEVYGESAAKPIYSAVFEPHARRPLAQAVAELRLPPDAEPTPLGALLPPPVMQPAEYALAGAMLPYATSLSAACSRISLTANLLPAEQRTASSRGIYIPTIFLSVVLLLLAGAALAQSAWEDQRYLTMLNQEIKRYEPKARLVSAIDQRIAANQDRLRLLDSTRRHAKADMDALAELTKLLPPPIWLNELNLTRTNLIISGEAEQSAPLLKVLDQSPLFQQSEFFSSPLAVGNVEGFRIRSQREGAPR